MTQQQEEPPARAVAGAVHDSIRRTLDTTDVPGAVAGVTSAAGPLALEAAGVRSLATGEPMTTDTVLSIFSATKALTGTVALQLVERGELDLEAPACEYAPGLADVQVIDGFDDDGSPRLRPPATAPTTGQLLTHTAGFGYDFFNRTYARLARDHGQPHIVAATRRALATPLLFDPGTRWEYGSSIDWVGQVIEGITGRRLGEVVRDQVLEPLSMSDTGFTLDAARRGRLASMHQRRGGALTATDFVLPEPEVHMGGHGLYSTVGDYLTFLRMWLNDGLADDGTVLLRPETVRFAARNQLPAGVRVTRLPGVIASLSNDVEFFPGVPKSWGYSFMINDEDTPTGRPAGSLAWAGLANLYYWIDRRHRIGGFWATQLFPFADPACLDGFTDFETTVNRAVQG